TPPGGQSGIWARLFSSAARWGGRTINSCGEIMSIKVLVADDHEVVRTGLVSLFDGSDIEVVAEATNADEAVDMTSKHRPDVVLLDIRMSDSDGLEALDK